MEQTIEVSAAQQISLSQASETLKMLEQYDPVQGEQTPDDDRLTYQHANVLLMVEHPGGGFGRIHTHSRYLSPTKLSVLSKVFMHSGSKLRVFLPDKINAMEERDGTITRCNYINNSMHEVHIAFRQPLNLRLFMDVPAHFAGDSTGGVDPSQVGGRLLMFCDDEADTMLIRHYLRQSRVQIAQADSLGVALDLVRSDPYDAVVCGDSVQGMPADRVMSALTDAGYTGGCAVICPPGGPQLAGEIAASPMAYLVKPLDESDVIDRFAEVMGTATGLGDEKELFSTLAPDASNRELVEWYIDHVKTLVHALQKVMMADGVDEARRYITTLRDTGASYGFAPISETAGGVLKELNASGSIAECRSGVQQLIGQTRRMRSMR